MPSIFAAVKWHCVFVLMILVLGGCKQQPDVSTAAVNKTLGQQAYEESLGMNGKALLLTRFTSLAQLNETVSIEYYKGNGASVAGNIENTEVHLRHISGDRNVTSILAAGVSQQDFTDARKGNVLDKIALALRSPFAVTSRADLQAVEYLGRRRPLTFGMGDVAFYDLAEHMVWHIMPEDTLAMSKADLSEKGYLNTFNHVTAQAFMTSVFSERLADFVADVHERYNLPELITGTFTEAQVQDLEKGPVDNYIDIINNEWGQELGKWLKKKYGISRNTVWTPHMMADYLNDIQRYHSWVFQIGFVPFRPEDEVVTRFANKINTVVNG